MSRFLVLTIVFCLVGLFNPNCSDNPISASNDQNKNENDSIPLMVIDTAAKVSPESLGTVYLNIDFEEVQKQLSGSSNPDTVLKKSAVNNRTNQLLWEIRQLFDANFTLTDSLSRSVKSNYAIDSAGKCSVRMIKVLRGFSYRVRVGFSGRINCPWSKDTLENIVNEYFVAYDTVDLRSKSKDTLNLVLTENAGAIYFVSIKNPPGKFTEGKRYSYEQQGQKFQALYSDTSIKGRIFCLKYDSLAQFVVNDDTGKVTITFSFNINSVIDNNIIEGTANVPDDGGIIVGPIVFEWDKPLIATTLSPKSGGAQILFSYKGRIHVDSSTIFKVVLKSDTTINIGKKTDLQEGDGYIYWLPSTTPSLGIYVMKLEGFVDDYGRKSKLASFNIQFQ